MMLNKPGKLTSTSMLPDQTRLAGRLDDNSKRIVYYAITLLVGIGIFWKPLRDLLTMALHSQLYSYIPLIFVVSFYLILTDRRKLFVKTEYCIGHGIVLTTLGAALGLAAIKYKALFGSDYYLPAVSLSFVTFISGAFLLFFGADAFAKAAFPLAFLLFAVPIPDLLLDRIITFLQISSTIMTDHLFNILGFFPLHEGFVFKFPELSIEIAKECSGIRSSMALLILSVLSGHYALQSNINRALLPFFAVAIAIFKNGVRIVGLTLGSIYVDPRIMTGPIHQKGGIPVFILAFIMLSMVIFAMRKLEQRHSTKPS